MMQANEMRGNEREGKDRREGRLRITEPNWTEPNRYRGPHDQTRIITRVNYLTLGVSIL